MNEAFRYTPVQRLIQFKDPPRGEEYWIPTDPRFTHAIDLVKYIKSHPEFGSYFSLGVAGRIQYPLQTVTSIKLTLTTTAAYPDGHPDSDLDEDTELQYLKAKVDAGADFIITQLFYDVEHFSSWIKKMRNFGEFVT